MMMSQGGQALSESVSSAEANVVTEKVPGTTKMVVHVFIADRQQFKRAFAVGTSVSVGRNSDCHIVLPSHHVSRRHLQLVWEPGGLCVHDQSSGGTLVGEERVRGARRALGTGNHVLLIGPYRLVVRLSAAPIESKEQRRSIHNQLLERLDLSRRKLGDAVSPQLRREVRQALTAIVAEPSLGIRAADQVRLIAELEDEALGLGPLEALLSDATVSEIMVVDPKTIYAERKGKLELTGRTFTDDEAVRSAIERIVTPLGRRIDESSPLVDARLKDGSRVNAVIPPLALRGPCITIRKFPSRRLHIEDLVRGGTLDERMATFIQRSVALKKNIVISGGTGSGKTTLLNVLSAAINKDERVITVEDAAELSLSQPHVVALESKPPNLEGRGEVTIRDLVKNALRMRPDRIIIGECRGGEALDMLQAMNTGHEGSMTTTHASSPKQAISRLETLCLLSGVDLPLSAIRRQIAESIDLIIQQSRLGDGSRRITSIVEVVGLDDEQKVEIRELFAYSSAAAEPAHVATGFMPTYLDDLERCFGHFGERIF